MRTAVPLQKEALNAAVITPGKTIANPLQLQSLEKAKSKSQMKHNPLQLKPIDEEEEEQQLPRKQDPLQLLSGAQAHRNINNPLQLKKENLTSLTRPNVAIQMVKGLKINDVVNVRTKAVKGVIVGVIDGGNTYKIKFGDDTEGDYKQWDVSPAEKKETLPLERVAPLLPSEGKKEEVNKTVVAPDNSLARKPGLVKRVPRNQGMEAFSKTSSVPTSANINEVSPSFPKKSISPGKNINELSPQAPIKDTGTTASEPMAASGQKPDEIVDQFNTPTALKGGGLLMRGVADANEMNAFVTSIPKAGTSQDDLKKRQYNLEKYSYIRGDTSMRVFGGRNTGLLVNPNAVRGQVRAEGFGKTATLAIHSSDVQSGKEFKPSTAKDVKKAEDVPKQFDAIVTEQNELKKLSPSKVGNWNEVEILSAKADAYVGLFYSWPNQKGDYDAIFTSSEKERLSAMWFKHTGQRILKIYIYKHKGQPETPEGQKQATEALGTPGASELFLMETIVFKGKEETK